MSKPHKITFAIVGIMIIFLFAYDRVETAKEKPGDEKIIVNETDWKNAEENKNQTITLQEVKNDNADNSPKSVSKEGEDSNLDCQNSPEIPSMFHKDKMTCQNIYKTDEDAVRDQVQKENSNRLVLYGTHVIYDCPAASSKIDNVNGECYQIAKFMDSYQYEKMRNLFEVAEPKKRLFIYLADTQPKLAQLCHADAVACFDGDSHIYLPLGEKGTRELYLREGEESFYGYGTKKNGMLYDYHSYAPKNCQTPSLLFHELTHYFNHLGIGQMPSWIDESVARMAVDKAVKEICSPGITYKNVTETRKGSVDNFDFNADDQVSSMVSDFWQGSKSKRDYLLGINDKIKEQGLAYFHKLYYTMGNKSDSRMG